MKIGIKLVVVISVINIIGISLLAGLTIIESRQEIVRLADEQVYSIALHTGEQIGKWFETYIGTTRTLAQVMEGYKDIPVEQRREQFNFMMRHALRANPELNSIYANWSPNGLDGLDEDYANTPGTDETGRFIPAWSLVNNQVILNYIVGFDWNMVLAMNLKFNFYEDYMLDPAVYTASDGRRSVIANMGSIVKDNGAQIGSIGCSMGISTLQAMISKIKPFGEEGFALLFSSGGIIAAHTDPDRLGKNMRESEQDTFGPYLETVVNAVTTGTAASFSYRPAQSESVMQYYAVPFTIGSVPQPWTLVVGVSQGAIMAPVYRMIRICVIIGVLTIIFMSAGAILTARSISNPLTHTMAVLKDIAGGDLTKEITIQSRDELGDLAHYLNFTVDQIKRLVLSIRNEVNALSQTGGELEENVADTAATVNEITANIWNITSKTERQVQSVHNTDSVMEQMLESLETLNRQIEKQTSCVSQSSSAVEQMLDSIHDVTQSLGENTANVQKLAHASEVGRSGLQEVSRDIQEIARESAGLFEINGVMENIANQTNLLSMNAAIEAAHAGEAGKGFAVVADEIRKLAESSGEQSKTISEVLAKIKDSIDTITRATNEVMLNFEDISEQVRLVTDKEAAIRTAMEGQEAESNAILESIGSLNEITGEVKQRAQGMLQGSSAVMQESKNLGKITTEIGNGMEEMSSGAEQINTAVNQVQDISGENHRQIAALMREVSRFKVEQV
ncbi:MAG: methyl-accepting chemotaxis protein [Spirochaetaceae bacterium]|jgi:methyl-accepting chemotaxis protein|nr:methyl-accepting chemotaxis protein [Spirochaetaceae bacterium]